MSLSRIAFGLLLGGAALGRAISVASADQPEILGVFKDWTAYKTGAGDARVCYALSKPIQSEPRKLKRDAAYFLINDWPGRNAKAEPEIVPGYVYKEGSEVTAQVGSDKFQLFTKNDGGAGGAGDASLSIPVGARPMVCRNGQMARQCRIVSTGPA
jgi:hypothetical protein